MASQEDLDFSIGGFLAACIGSAVSFLVFAFGIQAPESPLTISLLCYLINVVVFVGYVWYRRSRIISKVTFDWKDIFTFVFGSVVAYLGGIVIFIFGAYVVAGVIDSINPVSNDESIYYSNCLEVSDADVDSLYKGDPGYSAHLDRDGDGIACE